MPYAKKYPKRRYKRRFNRRGSYAVNSLAKRVNKLSLLVKPEFKYTNQVGTATPGTGGSFYLLNGLSKGDDAGQREGRQVFIKSIQGLLHAQISASATHTHVRYLIVADKQANGSIFGLSSLLDTSTAGATDAFRSLDYRRRFYIIKEGNIQLENTSRLEQIIKFYKKVNIRVQYDDSDSGAISDIITNSIYFLVISDEATNFPSVIFNMRVRYMDN